MASFHNASVADVEHFPRYGMLGIWSRQREAPPRATVAKIGERRLTTDVDSGVSVADLSTGSQARDESRDQVLQPPGSRGAADRIAMPIGRGDVTFHARISSCLGLYPRLLSAIRGTAHSWSITERIVRPAPPQNRGNTVQPREYMHDMKHDRSSPIGAVELDPLCLALT